MLAGETEEEEIMSDYISFLNEYTFHFSPDYDITHTLQRWNTSPVPQEDDRLLALLPLCYFDGQVGPGLSYLHFQNRFVWNAHIAAPLVAVGLGHWAVRVCDAFVRYACASQYE